jgi:hypothetical protein
MTSALQAFGYTDTEARFLELVIRIGGYFVRRQFNQFAACKTGKRTQDFVQKLLTNGHARMTVNRHARQVIHVHFKPFYLALNCEENRNRRPHQPRAILARLMALDYQLANPEAVLLVSESAKRGYLNDRFGISAGQSGSRIEKLLISRPVEETAAPSFLYIDDGAVTLAGFETALRRAVRIFEHVHTFDLLYLASHTGLFQKAEAIFRRTVLGLDNGSNERLDVDRLLHYFAELHRYEHRQTADFDKRRLDQLRDLKDEFSAPIHAALYHLWRECGETAVRSRLASNGSAPKQPKARFRAVVMEHDYAIFDNLHIAS